MDRAHAAKLWMRRVCASSPEAAKFTTNEAQFLELLTSCLSEMEHFSERWQLLREFLKGVETLEFSSCEQSVLLIERAVFRLKPRYILEVFPHFDADMRQLILAHWESLLRELCRCVQPDGEEFSVVCRAYVAYKARLLADCFEDSFVECDNLATSRGDSYIIYNDIYYYNFNHLCAEFGFSRVELIERLRLLSRRFFPDVESFALLGGEAIFAALIEAHLAIDGDSAPRVLKEVLPLLDDERCCLASVLLPSEICGLGVELVSRRLSFELKPLDCLEVFELRAIWEACEHDLDAFLSFMHNLYAFEGDSGVEQASPPLAWQADWQSLLERYGLKLSQWIEAFLPVYERFSRIMGGVPCYRLSAGWQLVCLSSEAAVDWLVNATTADGSTSSITALSLLHPSMSLELLAKLSNRWSLCSEHVPLRPSWDKALASLVLRFLLERQRSWLVERLSDLYLRGGGYELGQTRDWICGLLTKIFDALRLSPDERERLDALGLDFSFLPVEHNVFTGELVDASRWASPTSAHKYVRSLLRLEGRGASSLLSLVRERRLLWLEKKLRRLDFHTSVQQIVFCVEAFSDAPDAALDVLLLLRASSGERPSSDWLSKFKLLLDRLEPSVANQLLWQCYDFDSGEDPYTLNPGLFWAMRLIPLGQTVSQIARVTTEMVRRRPSFAIAALDSLDAISTRSSLSAILQMRRRIRNRRVLKLINRCIDRIAKQEGLERDIFLDYAVDTGDLDASSRRDFDFGSHSVSLLIDSEGKILTEVVDLKGRQLRSFPKSAKDAEPELYKEFQFTKKLLNESVIYQSRRLELAMVNGRHWKGGDFNEIFLLHPLMRQLGLGLIWGRLLEGDEVDSFTSSHQGLVAVDGQAYALDLDAKYRILHPQHMSSAFLDLWRKRLKALKLSQVFEQVSRKTYRAASDELNQSKVARFSGRQIEANALYELIKSHAWSTDGGGPWELGAVTHSTRRFEIAEIVAHVKTDALNDNRQFENVELYFFNANDQAMLIKDVPEEVFSETLRDMYLCIE